MKIIFALMGAPGIGKSTAVKQWSKKLFPGEPNKLDWYTISPDSVRAIAASPVQKPDGTIGISQQNESFVWRFVNDALDRRTQNGEMIIVDATHSRESAISNYKKYSDIGYRVVVVDFSNTATLEEVLQRNKKRERIKFVPEHAIETIYERIKTINLPAWVTVIQPDEFVGFFQDIKFNFSQQKSLTFIGDIHGCYRELQELLLCNDIDPDKKDKTETLIFIGDYFDRGPNPVETFRLLQTLKKNKDTLFLLGNHEEPLAFYTEFMKIIQDDIQRWVREHIEPFVDMPQELTPWNSFLVAIKLKKKPDPIRIPPAREQRLLRSFVNKSYKQLDNFIEELKEFPDMFEEFKDFIMRWRLPKDLVQNREKNVPKLKRTSSRTVKEFLLSDIKYTEVASFQKGLAQMFYADYHNLTILATHGGLVDIPTRLTPTSDMVRGVGSYEDALLCDETFYKRHPDKISIHGHRNMTEIPIRSTPGTYNINGDVDQGLRSVKFFLDGEWKTRSEEIEVTPFEETIQFYRKTRIEEARALKAKKLTPEEEGRGLLRMFQDHQHIDVKKLPNNIVAINFTKKAFEKGVWDQYTTKARGLFVDISKELKPNEINIVARGYEKFFNLGERFGIEKRDLGKLVYPLTVYEKANGYLGILSVDNRDKKNPKWFIASKTTTEGSFAKQFRIMIEPSLNNELMQFMIEKNVTLLFEVIEPEFDPHIQEYFEPELVLLDAVLNQMDFKRLPYSELVNFIELCTPQSINIREKEIAQICETYSDLNKLMEKIHSVNPLLSDYLEGYVIEDSFEVPTIFKIKTPWYSFWKKIRGSRDRIVNKLKKIYEKNPKEKATLSKSDLITLKRNLHTAEDIKVFNALVEIAEEDFLACTRLSIPELRQKILGRIKQ